VAAIVLWLSEHNYNYVNFSFGIRKCLNKLIQEIAEALQCKVVRGKVMSLCKLCTEVCRLVKGAKA
jgi:hypothetical protein